MDGTYSSRMNNKLISYKKQADGDNNIDKSELSIPNPADILSTNIDDMSFLNAILETNTIVPGGGVHPDFLPILEHLSSALLKLVSLTSCKAHPDCPESVFRYYLLTDSQLDALARHYHQIWPPTPETFRYPKHIQPWIGTPDEDTVDIATKRARMGDFIGVSGRLRRWKEKMAKTSSVTDDFEKSLASTGLNYVQYSGLCERKW